MSQTQYFHEKVFQFMGHHTFVLKVPAKGATGEMGLWMYQLVCMLESGKPFMLHCALKDAVKSRGQTVVNAVDAWIGVVEHFRAFLPNPDAPTVVCIDSYYFSQAVLDLLDRNRHFKYLLAATESKYRPCRYLKERVCTVGDWAALYNKTKKTLLTTYWHPVKNMGRKYVISNAFTETRQKQGGSIPAIDEYACMYSKCDRFNEFKNFTFPHKHGGRDRNGAEGAQHDFAVTGMLKNTFHVFETLCMRFTYSPHEKNSWTFHEHCCILADEIIEYTKQL